MTDYRGTLIDDDGVLVLSTVQQMADIGRYGFAYDFPAELLAHMTAGRIVAWETGGEGQFAVEVVFADEPPIGALGAFRLAVPSDDIGIAMPYSQFSYAAACADGVVAVTPGLSLRFPVRAGEYHIFLTTSGASFRVTITPSQSFLAPLTDDLPFLQATEA